jgi:hypothetical protein
MKKKMLLFVFCAIHVVVALAQEKYTDLIAWLPDEEGVVCYSLAQSPSITLEGTAFVVNTEKTSVTYEQGSVKYLTLGDGAQAVAKVDKPQAQSIKWQADVLNFKNCKPNAIVNIYDDGGRLQSQHRIDATGNLSLSFGASNRGVYVVKMNRWTLKIIRK